MEIFKMFKRSEREEDKKPISPGAVMGAAVVAGLTPVAGPEIVKQVGEVFNPPSIMSDVRVSPEIEERTEGVETVNVTLDGQTTKFTRPIEEGKE